MDKKGEADRFVGTKMPKHLFTGKAGKGSRDWRWGTLECSVHLKWFYFKFLTLIHLECENEWNLLIEIKGVKHHLIDVFCLRKLRLVIGRLFFCIFTCFGPGFTTVGRGVFWMCFCRSILVCMGWLFWRLPVWRCFSSGRFRQNILQHDIRKLFAQARYLSSFLRSVRLQQRCRTYRHFSLDALRIIQAQNFLIWGHHRFGLFHRNPFQIKYQLMIIFFCNNFFCSSLPIEQCFWKFGGLVYKGFLVICIQWWRHVERCTWVKVIRMLSRFCMSSGMYSRRWLPWNNHKVRRRRCKVHRLVTLQ